MSGNAAVIRRPDPKRPDGAGKHPGRSIRIDGEVWDAARVLAHSQGVSLSSVIRALLVEYVERGGLAESSDRSRD